MRGPPGATAYRLADVNRATLALVPRIRRVRIKYVEATTPVAAQVVLSRTPLCK